MRLQSTLPLIVAMAIMLAACGGDKSTATPSPTLEPTMTPTATPVPTETRLAPTPTPGSGVDLDRLQEELTSNRLIWEAMGPDSYQFEFRRICFCIREFVAPVKIAVRGGTIVDVTFLESGLEAEEPDPETYETIEGLLELLQEALDRKTFSLQVNYDPNFGYPTDADIDYDARIADEEFGFTVTDLSITQEQSIEGRWEGVNRIVGQELTVVVDIKATPDGLTGTIDIPLQGTFGMELLEVRLDGASAHFELATNLGVAVWEGDLLGDTISGEFNQGGVSGTFELTGGQPVPDDPGEEPVPYLVEDLTFDNAQITLAGTLTLPPTPGPHPALILITGSGAQDRNEDIFGFKIFEKIADHMTRNGIAVLRWDDRGVGGSTGDPSLATLEDLAGDVQAALRLLRDRDDIDAGKVGLFGHSEGALVASLVSAGSDDIAFAVLMAGPAVSTTEILEAQGELILRAGGATDERIAEQRRVQAMLFDAVRTDQGWDEAAEAIRQVLMEEIAELPESERVLLGDIDEYVELFVQGQITAVRTPAFKFFLDYDPRPDLERLTLPLLALFGGLDLQVPADLNAEPMRVALGVAGNEDFTIEVIEDANHLFQAAVTGTRDEYATLHKEFIPGFLESITDWLVVRTGVDAPPRG